MSEDVPFESGRRLMIELQLRRRGIQDERVLEAMFRVPRHEFVPSAYVNAAYDDRPLPIGESETISQPYIVAVMTQASRVEAGDRALEIGAGAGYQAAVLAYLGAKVYTVERNAKLAQAARERLKRLGYENVEVITGDGSEGYAPAAPYQVILVTAAAPRVPETLLDQLAEAGRLVIPVGDLHHQTLFVITRRGNEISQEALDPCQFVPLIGKHGWPES
jgi:protein-L-isoaspartate(D-aspartate) O-methyltransferase